MFYIDELLYPDILINYLQKSATSPTTTITSQRPSLPSIYAYSTVADVEQVPSEITESNDDEDGRDVLLQDGDVDNIDEVAIPRALPLLYVNSPK